MALFSRGSQPTDPEQPAQPHGESDDEGARAAGAEQTPAVDDVAVDAASADGAQAGADVPEVTISTSAFGGFGADTTARPLAEASTDDEPTGQAPPASETIPGLPDNVVLRGALTALSEDPEPHEVLNAARQLLQGNVYLRVKGNAQELVGSGAELPLAVATRDDGQFVMLYSCGKTLAEAVQADGDTETSAMGQAGPAVLQYVLAGEFAGVVIDHASAPAAAVLPRALLERIVAEMDPEHTVKKLVCGPRTEQTAGEVAQALTTAPLWIAVNRASEDADWGVAEAQTHDGQRLLNVYSHPLEVVALGRNDRPMPFTPRQLGAALRSDEGVAGVVVDPAGPWIRLSRDQLAPVMALPEPEPAQRIAEEGEDGAEGASGDDDGATDAGAQG